MNKPTNFFIPRRTITCKTRYLFRKGVKFRNAQEVEALSKFDLSTV